VMDLILDDDVSKALQYFDSVKKGSDNRPLEVRMYHKDGALLDTLWSAHWSQRDKSLFCVIHDMTMRKKAERLKEEVILMVNHDMRTPLTTVQVSLELLAASDEANLSARGKELISKMSLSCNQVLRLTKDMLDLDRLESGHLELELAHFDIGQVAARAIQVTAGLAYNQNIQLSTDIRELVVLGDQARLEQVVINILANAMKYSPAGSRVHLAIRPDQSGKMAMVSVRDEGQGIPAQMLTQIFEPYRQVKQNRNSVKDGSGLGLAICKALVGEHGGKIWVESELGKGSIFIFTVPLKQ
jgi:signal transduction histidine kinase